MSPSRIALILLTLCLIFLIISSAMGNPEKKETAQNTVTDVVPRHLEGIDPDKVDWKAKDDEYWRSVLSEQQLAVCRGAGTERPFSGQYCAFKKPGTYRCFCCGQELFDGGSKFDSGTGWPSFFEALKPGLIDYHSDSSHGMVRTEVRCSRCGAHLGHVFDDGPPPTGKRYCINSICLLHTPSTPK